MPSRSLVLGWEKGICAPEGGERVLGNSLRVQKACTENSAVTTWCREDL